MYHRLHRKRCIVSPVFVCGQTRRANSNGRAIAGHPWLGTSLRSQDTGLENPGPSLDGGSCPAAKGKPAPGFVSPRPPVSPPPNFSSSRWRREHARHICSLFDPLQYSFPSSGIALQTHGGRHTHTQIRSSVSRPSIPRAFF